MPEEFDTRLRELEISAAASGETMRSIQGTLTDIKQQIQGFLEKAHLALAVEGRVERAEEAITELFRKADATFKIIDSHKADYATLKAECALCMKKHSTENSWWKDRAGRIFDAGLIAAVVWLLTIYKGH